MALETSLELLNRIRASYDNASWYRLAKIIGTHESTVNNWKHGRSAIGREYVTRIAELLGESPEYVLACVENEREHTPEGKKMWQRIAAKFRSHAASVLLAGMLVLGLGSPTPAEASNTPAEGASAGQCILSQIARRVRRWWQFATWFPLPA